MLLVAALIHGRPYFHAGRTMYIGERLVKQQHYAEALPYLRERLQIAPASDKAALLTARAAILSGDLETAQKALEGHNGGRFEDSHDSDFEEVNALWSQSVEAFEKAREASKLEGQPGQEEEAARLMHQASSMYPESIRLSRAADFYDGSVNFAHKDYDGFLAIAQKEWTQFSDYEAAGMMASALACKYAVTGDEALRADSEAMLGKTDQMIRGDVALEKDFQEYSERIRYRLEKRVIIDKPEYDRRFRHGTNGAK